jgi:D-alanyl-D-alanine carboxypeptidase/D-alanyl-D-alanine-endopeptidase (penicillin-binding protein 4)
MPMRIIQTIFFLILSLPLWSQDIGTKLTSAVQNLEQQQSMTHASIGFYVVNATTGNVVFDKNAQLGLVPASTMKVMTSVSAFELLGKSFRYKTAVVLDGLVNNQQLSGYLIFKGSGDPTLGSWRWKQNSQAVLFDKLIDALEKKSIKKIKGDLLLDMEGWETNATPRGWTWEDVGNYYGAGAAAINWNENQYTLTLKPGKNVGDSVKIIKTTPTIHGFRFMNELKTGKPGSGDQSIIYLPEKGILAYLRGTIPAGVESFEIKGSLPWPAFSFLKLLQQRLTSAAITFTGKLGEEAIKYRSKPRILQNEIPLTSFESPPLDSINYWFMRESINLYGEAFVKTIALEKKGFAATDSGLAIIKHFWSSRGIEKPALKMWDGSGLSPANRITAHALVTALNYAKKQDYYPSFLNALPLMNGIKMKSGYINGVRSYAGYIKNKSGEEYIFAFIINNFDGSPGTVREQMWKILDLLK